MKVYNLESPRTGKAVANQFVIKEKGEGALGNFIKRETFQSYGSIIAVVVTWDEKDCTGFKTNPMDVVLDEAYWNYSKTTSKYRNIFLGESTLDTATKIKNGEYKLENLNK